MKLAMKKNIVKAENTDDDFLVVKQKIKGGKDEERSDTKMKELTRNFKKESKKAIKKVWGG